MSTDLSTSSPDVLAASGERVHELAADVDIDAVLRARSMRSHYQPIISIRGKRVIGLEALIRATHPTSGLPIAPGYLFDAANRRKQSLLLDRL